MSRLLARLLRSQFPSAHPDYTSEYDGIIDAPSGTVAAKFGNVVLVRGNSVTVNVPPLPTGLNPIVVKDAFHCAVVNLLGSTGLVINGNGNDINGSPTLSLPASAGAFAELYWSVQLQQWAAFVAGGSGSAFVPPPTYFARGPSAGDQTFVAGAGTAGVTGVAITTAAFSALQKAIVRCVVEVHNATVGSFSQADFAIFDGSVGTIIEGPLRESIDPSGETTDYHTTTIQTEIVGDGLGRTFGLQLAADASGSNVVVRQNTATIIVEIVDG